MLLKPHQPLPTPEVPFLLSPGGEPAILHSLLCQRVASSREAAGLGEGEGLVSRFPPYASSAFRSLGPVLQPEERGRGRALPMQTLGGAPSQASASLPPGSYVPSRRVMAMH